MDKTNDSVVRYCKPTQVQDGMIQVSAFFLRRKDVTTGRPSDEKSLSVDHFEHYPIKPFENILGAMKRRGISPRPNGFLARISYCAVEADIKASLFLTIDIRKTHDSHCLIDGLYDRDDEAAILFVRNISEQTQVSNL